MSPPWQPRRGGDRCAKGASRPGDVASVPGHAVSFPLQSCLEKLTLGHEEAPKQGVILPASCMAPPSDALSTAGAGGGSSRAAVPELWVPPK